MSYKHLRTSIYIPDSFGSAAYTLLSIVVVLVLVVQFIYLGPQRGTNETTKFTINLPHLQY